MLPALTEKENIRRCNTKVTSCGVQPSNGITCHRFYKCIDGIAYSCQNPKLFQSKCSGKYWNRRGKADYICETDKEEQELASLNAELCKPDRII